MLAVALRNAGRLSALVDNLLVLVRLDSSDSLTAFSTTDVVVSRIVAGAADTVRPTITERSQTLDIEIADSSYVVRGDAEQLDRALVNLLSNASKYTPDGGAIEVRVALEGDCVQIDVRDSGIGIPLDEQDHLFNRFFRASTARDHAISGNGLGLAIVKSIVERHDGSVSVVSAPGMGAQFTVLLPLARIAAGIVG